MAFLKYTVVRLGITAVVLIVCLQLGLGWIFSGVAAVVIAFCISFLFLGKLRNAAADSLQYRFSGKAAPLRTSTERNDAAAEDGFMDAREQGARGPVGAGDANDGGARRDVPNDGGARRDVPNDGGARRDAANDGETRSK